MKKRREMVKTRHQTGIEEMPSHLYTVETRSRRRSVIVEDGGESDSDRSEYAKYHPKRHRRETSAMKVDDSLSKYSKEDSSTAPTSTRTRYSHRRQHHTLEEESEDHTPEKESQKGTSMASISSHSSTNHAFMNGDCNSDEKQCVRRSTRQRKFIYDNLNQTWLLASSIPEFAKLDPLFESNKRIRQDEDKNISKRSDRKRNYELRRLGLGNTEMDFEDMYSRVKRERRKSVHAFYSRRVSQDVGSMEDTEDTDRNDSTDDDVDVDEVGSDLEGASASGEEESQEEGTAQHSKYCLRPKKPITERFQFPIEPARPKRSAPTSLFHTPPHHRQPRERHTFKSPAHRSPLFRRKRHATHNISSSSSSSDDERRFERRKARSMARARNRCLPLNFREEDATKGVLCDRAKIGTSLADIDPMNIDRLIKFNSVGGLDHHIKALKEMILFPLMYPEVFEKFKISPPRGVLFHGPPGTGKTLVARALANECSQGDKHVAFFMRKGADCLSKWVGESERQLRLLFDQAYSMRPSIIFFDEIDGLAPVRSSRQDQIHSSIVSTLLALMDGLDSRGEIVVIGATNRVDAIDPALRRPGRFDREFLFPLPSLEARCTILHIHTKDWHPLLRENFLKELAVRSAGYCGADLKALCAEAALIALRRRYPQIYRSTQKLQLDVNSIQIHAQDFEKAMKKIVPSAQRSSSSPAHSLPPVLRPLLQHTLAKALTMLKKIYPAGIKKSPFCSKDFNALKNNNLIQSASESEMSSEEQSDDNSDIDRNLLSGSDGPRGQGYSRLSSHFQELRLSHHIWPPSHRPRLLLSGKKDQGQSIHLAPAVLYCFEHLPVHRLDLPTLYAVSCRTPEEACAQVFREALRSLPGILYLPHIGQWWETLGETVRATFLTLLHDIEPCIPLLLFATSDACYENLPSEVQDLFIVENQVLQMKNPSNKERREFFSLLLTSDLMHPPKHRKKKEKNEEVLPIVPPPEPRKLTNSELEKLRQQEEATLRELRLFLREILNKLARDRRFSVFTKPVDPDEVPDYHEVIKNPMDLETMMSKIDLHHYETVGQFLADIDLICHNALEYNPDRDPSDKLIRHRACALKDTAHALVDSELDEEFEKICHDIHEARKQRGETPTKYAPKHYHVLPRNLTASSVIQREPTTENILGDDEKNASVSLAQSYPTRFSRRLRGMATTPPSSDTEMVKKNIPQPPPRRPTQYMIWRKRKSPWFGCCRRKLIRRPIHHKRLAQKIPLSIVNKPGESSEKFVPLSPVPEASDKHELENTQIEKDKLIEKDTLQNEMVKQLEIDTTIESAVLTKNMELINNNSPEIVFVSAVKNSGVTNLSTSESNTAYACDKLHQHEYCSIDTNSNECKINVNKSPAQNEEQGVLANKEEIANEESSVQDSTCMQPSSRDTSSKEQEPDVIKEVTVDMDHLHKLLDYVVNLTDGYSVEMLQQLHCILQRAIYRYRKDWNKNILLQELEKEMECFRQYISS